MQSFLVIQALPEGMVAVLRHTVHGLLLAEMTGRVPVVHWGGRFLYRERDRQRNCVSRFFETRAIPSECSLTEYEGIFSPPGWNALNLLQDGKVGYRYDENRQEFAPLEIHDILHSEADVVVYTHWHHLVDIVRHIPAPSEYFGLEPAIVAGRIFRKYLSILPEILGPARTLLAQAGAGTRLVGVHCRGSDKITEHALVTPEDYRNHVDRILRDDDRVFLATDSVAALEKFKGWYGDRLLFTDCERSSNTQGVHFTAADREKAGRDFLVDAYLLSRCQVHFGNEGSHVSYLVQTMLRDNGRPYDNFVTVTAGPASRLKRTVFHRLPGWGRKQVGLVLHHLGLRRRKEEP
jgi:protein O-GlcNAc transferase